VKPPGPTAELRRTLTKRKKSELVDVLMDLAEGDRGVLRRLTARFDVAATPDELVSACPSGKHAKLRDAAFFQVDGT
jgi:hypothetical protein